MTSAINMPEFLQGGWRECQFEYFRDGVEICRLSAANLKSRSCAYQPGAKCRRICMKGLKPSSCWKALKATRTDLRDRHARDQSARSRPFGSVAGRLRGADPMEKPVKILE